jgi:two-component system cell cycle sensor histidine kinase/response regulator CckA
VMHPDDRMDSSRNLANLAAGGSLDEVLHRIVVAGGGYRWWETSARTLETETGQHLVVLMRDVTERLAAQEERAQLARRMYQTEKLEGLGLLAGGIAHDFNNLMVAVRTNAELAVHALDAGRPARTFVDDIGLAAEHARDLTRKLLAYAGRTSTSVQTVDLSAAAAGIAQLFRGTLAAGVQLSVDADAEPALVVGDEAQLGQVVLNLLRNAAEAIEGGGTIALRSGVRALGARDLARCIYAEGGRAGSYAFVTVVDTGRGIAPEAVGRIFDPFFTTKPGGSGLGLASVLGTVRAHHGALDLVTRVGGGTRFEIFLPSAEAAELHHRVRAVSAAGAALVHGAILVVDDQAPVRRAAAQLLASRGYETLEAGGGREAIETMRAAPERLGAVLLDVTMPDFGGNRVFAELRRLRQDLPIVFMSGHSEEDVASLTKDRTRVATIAKPFTGDEVEEALRIVTRED